MNSVYENILMRRSCRSFSGQPIAAEALHDILTAGTHAPSAHNSQTRQFTVLTKPQTIQIFTAEASRAMGRPEYDFFKPTVLVLVSNDPQNPNSGFDCACSLQNMFLAAHSLGIGSCWINQLKDAQGDYALRALLSSLGVPSTHHVFGIAVLGHPSAPCKPMDKSAQVIHFAD